MQTITLLLWSRTGIGAKANAKAAVALGSYARSGGIVVFAMMFSNSIRMDALSALFAKTFGLPWTNGHYFRTTHAVNPAFFGAFRESLPPAYSMKALFVDGVEGNQLVYVPAEGAVTESRVFPVKPVIDKGEALIAVAPVGDGFVGYIGDVNNEAGSQRVFFSMVGAGKDRPVAQGQKGSQSGEPAASGTTAKFEQFCQTCNKSTEDAKADLKQCSRC